MNAERISRPRSVRIGIDCRFGSDVESRPVAATVWLNVVCSRAVGLREQRRQRPEVRVEQLRELAPLLDHRHDRVLVPDRPQHLRVGRVAGLALAARGQPELLEQHAADLLGRADHELRARELVRLRLELLDPVGEPRRDLAHPVGVDLHARLLHLREHVRERQLDGRGTAGQVALLEPLEQRADQTARRLRAAHERDRLLVGRRSSAAARRRTRPPGRRARTTLGPGSIR